MNNCPTFQRNWTHRCQEMREGCRAGDSSFGYGYSYLFKIYDNSYYYSAFVQIKNIWHQRLKALRPGNK